MNNEQLTILISLYGQPSKHLDYSDRNVMMLQAENVIAEDISLKGIDMFKLTDRGRVWMNHIMNVPFPTHTEEWKF